MTVAPEAADVQALTENVWSSFLGDEEPLIPQFLEPDSAFGAEVAWSSAVSIGGGWDGTVTVEVSHALAQEFTRRMLGFEPDEEVAEADIADAVGELVNMIGGNIKSLMPGPSVLTIPIVAAGHAAHASSNVQVARFDGIWDGEPVRVTVHAKSS